VWYEGFLFGEEDLTGWEEFTKGLCMRFGRKEDVVKEFNYLVQEKNMEEYVEKFKELKSLMNALNMVSPEAYYISSFLSGLIDDVRPTLNILKPATLMQAFE